MRRKCMPPAILERLSQIFGHTDKGLTGSQIHNYLLQVNISIKLNGIDGFIKLKSKENDKLSELKKLLLSKMATIEN